MYKPQPIDTSGITIPSDLENLVEVLAKNTHEVWAAERIAQGWVYGPKRDDALKHHPCLVPYEELSEDEKKFDIETAVNAVKLYIYVTSSANS